MGVYTEGTDLPLHRTFKRSPVVLDSDSTYMESLMGLGGGHGASSKEILGTDPEAERGQLTTAWTSRHLYRRS